MRLGIFSDVHSNWEALQAVQRAYAVERIDRYLCLGDTVGYAADPDACCQAVRSLAAVTVLGNHDAAVAGRMGYAYYYDAARQALEWHTRQLSQESIKWLRSLPYEHRELDFAFCHGSPLNLEEFEYVFALEQAAELLPHLERLARVTFIGHSHLCKAFALSGSEARQVIANRFTIRDNFKYVISVGSVGQPRDYDPRASYTVFDTDTMTFEFKRTAYDIEGATKKIFGTELEQNFANRLFIGV